MSFQVTGHVLIGSKKCTTIPDLTFRIPGKVSGLVTRIAGEKCFCPYKEVSGKIIFMSRAVFSRYGKHFKGLQFYNVLKFKEF